MNLQVQDILTCTNTNLTGIKTWKDVLYSCIKSKQNIKKNKKHNKNWYQCGMYFLIQYVSNKSSTLGKIIFNCPSNGKIAIKQGTHSILTKDISILDET